jgi:poly-gamma-glutamate capsule biosynthesis protein CapA/YwtB (metallophosphatase superfamily)
MRSGITKTKTKIWPFRFVAMVSLFLFVFVAFGEDIAGPSIKANDKFDPKRPLERELEMSVRDGFTLIAVGDCIISRPLSQYANRDEAVAKAFKILKDGDATYGNLETTILNARNFQGHPYSWDGDWTLTTDPATAKDLATIGFDLFSRANNHDMDWGLEGMRETSRWLDENGLVHAGAGETEGIARSAQYFESDKGRIAIVSMASTFRPTTNALATHGASPGRPGLSGLTLTETTIVPKDVMTSLVRIKQTLFPEEGSGNNEPEKLALFGKNFETGEKFGYRYAMNAADLDAILKGVRQGKQNSDFLLATIHAHESSNANFPQLPAAFLRDLAHATIDAGGDAFITTGIHHLGPIEIYKGRPIFYGLGNFFWSDIQEPLPADLYQRNAESLSQAFHFPHKSTDADLTQLLNAGSFANEVTFQTIIAESRFHRGRLAEIRLHPIDLGYGLPLTESGIPRIAVPEKAREILQRLQEISRPYGTKIRIENHIGIIDPSESQ